MSVGARYTEEAQGAVVVCGLCSGGVNEPLSDVAIVVAFTSTGGDLRSTLGRSAWTTVVIGSECEVPPRLSALRGNVPMSVRCVVEYIGLHVVMMSVDPEWSDERVRRANDECSGRLVATRWDDREAHRR